MALKKTFDDSCSKSKLTARKYPDLCSFFASYCSFGFVSAFERHGLAKYSVCQKKGARTSGFWWNCQSDLFIKHVFASIL